MDQSYQNELASLAERQKVCEKEAAELQAQRNEDINKLLVERQNRLLKEGDDLDDTMANTRDDELAVFCLIYIYHLNRNNSCQTQAAAEYPNSDDDNNGFGPSSTVVQLTHSETRLSPGGVDDDESDNDGGAVSYLVVLHYFSSHLSFLQVTLDDIPPRIQIPSGAMNSPGGSALRFLESMQMSLGDHDVRLPES